MNEPRDAVPVLMAGTGNDHKTGEIAEILAGLPLSVASARCLTPFPVVDETGSTFAENAALKARAFARAASRLPGPDRPRWVLSDDSGLCVDAIGGRPGVHSSRYAEDLHGPGVGDRENIEKLLGELEGVGPDDRTARFVCTLAVAAVCDDGETEPPIVLTARGECQGRILGAPRGNGGFGYDPVFLVPELGRTFAELTPAEKNRRSHRGRALARLREALDRELRT